ncbi:adenylate/guanylate cyclase domain-containing protein [Sneathiella limimaris]|uniref:adenylate/guanylate cyclase domain-containing protein n=1 Tax=Sneathiella limimaris TaxID=1964213 RepID=UPI00146A536C|nr:adenylate/guanylate cyclase domain-containing protein [Sneathiella limimaris]
MTSTNEEIEPKRNKRFRVRAETVRLYSGLTLMLFLITHLLNHSLGLISLEALEAGRYVFTIIWRSVPGTIVLLSAIILHLLLTTQRLLMHRSFRRIPPKEILQIILGLAIPPLMVGHIIGTRIAHEMFGIIDSYSYVLYSIWIASPIESLLQTTGLLVAWIHGCLGIHFWLRLKPWYENASPYLYTAAIILPLLALCGLLVGANMVEVYARDVIWRQTLFDSLGLTQEDIDWAISLRLAGLKTMIGILAVLLLSRIFWFLHFRKERMITVTYPNGKKVSAPPGTTVLEISQLGGVPHASVCGGRGRCSTCRIRISAGLDNLDPPSDEELSVLKRVGAIEGTRLACQVPAMTDLTVTPLLSDRVNHRSSFSKPKYLQGGEKEIAILFADLRAFTKFSEAKLPYDVVFIINQYFRHMGEAIETAGGHLDKFIGDGVMALFGLEDTTEVAARKALKAAKEMALALEALNEDLQSDLKEPLKIGIGIHMGQTIIGEMGYGRATSVTAIGDAVNTASRLEAMNKDFKSELIFSDRVAREAGYTSQSRTEEVLVRGRNEPLNIHIISDAKTLEIND